NPHSPFGRFDVRTKALTAKDHGAVGMLLISREENLEHDRLTKMEFDQSLGEAAIPTMVISRATARNILGLPNEESLKDIEKLAGMKKDGQNVNIGFRDVSPRVSFSISLVKESVAAYNVIGILDGTDPQLKKEAIVIGAHYDHLGHGGNGSLAANSTEIHHGADDNASGTAAIIELARQVAAEKKNKRTIIFIAFSGEEEGLFGSNYYVNNPVFPLDKTVAMINLDMVGRLNDNKLTIGGIGTASEWKRTVEGLNDSLDFLRDSIEGGSVVTDHGYHLGAGPRFTLQLNEDGFGPSDHSSFYGKKIPVLFFFTGTHNDYHKPTDTAEKINYAGEKVIVAFVGLIATAIDINSQRPTYTVAKTTMQGGRSGFNISLGTIPNYADSDNGLLLDGVRDGSPAAKAGIQAGDRVIKLAGHDIRNVMDYTYMLGEMKADVEYEIVVVRGGETLTKKITPVRRQ
ncbi:MAG TPA: M20/M25/M40 family metallo-hydrolase, partial [Pyrinomonadaceae bacterium]|nr:M20/M25/M40 family metallo-hydrolase [Pyrinomonadaceae bacterium]